MSETEEALRRWTEAGLIDPALAERIRAFEAARRTAPTSRAAQAEERPGLVEVLLYLGIAVLSVGVFALLAQNWSDLAALPRVLAIGVPAAFSVLVGALLRTLDEPGYRRGAAFAWAAAVALAAGTLAVAIHEYEPLDIARDDDREQMLVVAAFAVAMALGLWALHPSTLQVLTLGGALLFLGQAVGNWPDEYSSPLAGTAVTLFGLAGLLLAETGRLVPRGASRLVFALLIAYGTLQPGFDGGGTPWEIPAFIAAAALLAASIWRGSLVYVLVGVGLFFIALVRAIFQNFSDQLGAPVALIISGALLIGAVLLLARLVPSLRSRRSTAA